MIIVSKSKIFDKKLNAKRFCKYSDVPTDKNLWVHDLTYRPIPYDLLYLKMKGNDQIKNGWWTGVLWKGLKVIPEDKVVAWKRNLNYSS